MFFFFLIKKKLQEKIRTENQKLPSINKTIPVNIFQTATILFLKTAWALK